MAYRLIRAHIIAVEYDWTTVKLLVNSVDNSLERRESTLNQ